MSTHGPYINMYVPDMMMYALKMNPGRPGVDPEGLSREKLWNLGVEI